MSKRTPRSAREAALDILLKIVKQKAYSQIVLNDTLEKSPFERKDRGFISHLVYGVIQNRLTLEFYLSGFIKKNQKLDSWVRELLYISFYQKVYLNKIPDHAIVNEAVNIAKRRGHKGTAGFVNGVLRQLLRGGVPDLQSIEPEIKRWSVTYSHPEWLIKEWQNQYGTETMLSILKANQQIPETSVRTNQMKTSSEKLKEKMMTEGFEVNHSTLLPEALICHGGNPALTDLYREGFLTVQDESSMLVAHALDAKDNMLVLDTCAGPGGKTTHIAERMRDKGKIIALDLHEHKAKLIRNQAVRLNLQSIEALALDARNTGENFEDGMFDRILVDAPCTGFGVIKRKPEIKYEKTLDDVMRISLIQKDILKQVVPLLKPGGVLIYSTCTIEKNENQQVAEFLKKEYEELEWDQTLIERLPEEVGKAGIWTDNAMVQILPQHFNTDGFFIAAFKKKGV